MMIKKYILLLLTVVLLITSSCNKKVDPIITTEPRPDDISIFIWAAMHDYYLWYEDVPNLSPGMLDYLDGLYIYLNNFDSNYSDLFEDLLYERGEIDKWSWLIEDWEEQEREFSGISYSMGYDFGLVRMAGTDDLFGYVRYVLEGEPANLAGIERGDLFLEVDGEQLTVDNYMFLLFDQSSYDLSMAYFSDPSTIALTGATVSLTEVELQENPILVANVMDIGDGLKTAYLMYNAFTSDFDMELNDAFGIFKNEQVDRLILDLRYNGGGSIRTATHLASMIHTTDEAKVFAQYAYNDKYQNYLLATYGVEGVTEWFTGKLDTTTYTHETQLPTINSLGLNEVYVIGTYSSASASEMIINGLESHINVVHVGNTTRGKYTGSFTIKDYYTKGVLNEDHSWALQPIVLKIANSLGNTDFIDGLFPDVVVSEDYRDMLPLGDPNETLLAAAIDNILGTKKVSMRPEYEPLDHRFVAGSKDFRPSANRMYFRYPKYLDEDFLKIIKEE